MADQVISLTNRKKIPMGLPNGQGGQHNLKPGETKIIRGDFERYHKMMKSMNGLVVKLVDGKSRLVEAEKKLQNDVRLVRVTNHRNIPMRLATGIGQKAVNIGAKATSEPFLGRISTIKQMSGITVRPVEEPADKAKTETGPGEPKTESEPAADGSDKITVEGDGKLQNGATAEAAAIAKQAAEDEKRAKAEAEANDPLAKLRRDLTLPATAEEWAVHKQQLTWPDVRGIAKELDIKTSDLNKAQLLEEIEKKLYPGS